MKSYIHTLGCKVNQYESQQMQAMLTSRGVLPAGQGEPVDVYIINSCTVTATADQKTRQALSKARREHPGAVLCLTGCVPQSAGETAAKLDADVILGNANRNHLWAYIQRFLATGAQVVAIEPHSGEYSDEAELTADQGRTRAYIKIEDGCDRFCAYCVIPYARGPVRSRPLGSVAEEARILSENYREIVLVGINLSAYGQDIGLSLPAAVAAASAPEGIRRVRLGSLEPDLLSDGTLEQLVSFPKLCPQFHLSLQSGCDATLRRMNRRYDTSEYMRVVNRIRALWDNPAITTDIMVGFPGESEKEFAQSLDFVSQMRFSRAHCFVYSRREGTPAASMPGQVPPGIAGERAKRMMEAAEQSSGEFLRTQDWKKAGVLIERCADGVSEGYSENYCHVKIAAALPPGEICDVELYVQDDELWGRKIIDN